MVLVRDDDDDDDDMFFELLTFTFLRLMSGDLADGANLATSTLRYRLRVKRYRLVSGMCWCTHTLLYRVTGVCGVYASTLSRYRYDGVYIRVPSSPTPPRSQH